MEIRYDEIELFNRNISTLKKTSLDEGNAAKSYMTNAELPVIHFDKVKEAYVKNLKTKYMPCSSDALYIGDGGKISFIEFKNGKMSNNQKYNVYQKIYDSLLIFCDITGKNISFCRDNVEFILVYNETKNNETKNDETKNDEIKNDEIKNDEIKNDEIKDKKEENLIQESESRVLIGEYFSRKGNQHLIRFGLERFEKLYFKRVFTYTEKEFEDEFVKSNS